MAPQNRQEDPAVKQPDSPQMEEMLRTEPFGFDFFQAVRLLNRLLPDRTPVGKFSDPGSETVRFGAAPDLGFPPSQIAGLDWPENAQPRMDVNFMGLTGPMGVLPLYYTVLLRERLRAHDGALRAFFDIFNHRAISLFYRAWEKYHFTVAYERNEEDALSPHLMDLLGLGTPGLSCRQGISDEALLFRCGLLASQARSAEGLRALLTDYFDVPVEIEQFVGKWHSIEEDYQCRFSDTGVDSEQLGVGTVVGDAVWDQQSGIRIRLGPLTLEQYLDFLPEGRAHSPLRALVQFFAGSEFDFELQLILKKEETPPCELGGDGAKAPRLGWLTWAANAPPSVDPADTILQI